MPHPSIDNATPFETEFVPVADQEGRPLLVCVVKATYEIQVETGLSLAEKQLAVNLSGEHWGDPDNSSYKYEPETAFIKPATDIALIGHARAARVGDTKVDVGLQVGPVKKVARVFGDRFWTKKLGLVRKTEPQAFEQIPLIYERAFGGWDSSDPDPDTDKFEPRNPVGVGFKYKKYEEGMRLPNLEDPRRPLNSYGDKPPPAGFGFVSPHWQPRAALAGTYDKKWQKTRSPLLPEDFDVRFFNAASPGMIAPGYLQGNESVTVVNASSVGRLSFNLPGVQSPKIKVHLRGRKEALLESNLDTVIINTDEDLVLMLWRANLVLRSGPHDIVAATVTADGAPELLTGTR